MLINSGSSATISMPRFITSATDYRVSRQLSIKSSEPFQSDFSLQTKHFVNMNTIHNMKLHYGIFSLFFKLFQNNATRINGEIMGVIYHTKTFYKFHTIK